jgi:excisionase family DNA binding protein
MQVTHTYSDDDLVPIGIAARILGVTVGTVRRWEAAGHLAARRTPGDQRRFLVGDLRALLAGAA